MLWTLSPAPDREKSRMSANPSGDVPTAESSGNQGGGRKHAPPKPEELAAQIASGKCSHFIRGKRFCRQWAASGQQVCSKHDPEALAVMRQRDKAIYAQHVEAKKAADAAGLRLVKKKKQRLRISSSQKRMVNPLGKNFQVAVPAPKWAEVFCDPSRPLCVDVGCARGDFSRRLAREHPEVNFLGLEIREPLVTLANQWVEEHLGSLLKARNLHYVSCNINASILSLLDPDKLNGKLAFVSLQFPDPWSKKCHRKRRVVQPSFVKVCACFFLSYYRPF